MFSRRSPLFDFSHLSINSRFPGLDKIVKRNWSPKNLKKLKIIRARVPWIIRRAVSSDRPARSMIQWKKLMKNFRISKGNFSNRLAKGPLAHHCISRSRRTSREVRKSIRRYFHTDSACWCRRQPCMFDLEPRSSPQVSQRRFRKAIPRL